MIYAYICFLSYGTDGICFSVIVYLKATFSIIRSDIV